MTHSLAREEMAQYREHIGKKCAEVFLLTKLELPWLGIPSHKFGHLPQSHELHLAWEAASQNRLADAKGLQDALEYVVTALKSVEESLFEADQQNALDVLRGRPIPRAH